MNPSNSLVLFDIDGTLMRGAGEHHKAALVEGIRQATGHSTTLAGVNTSGMLDRDLIALMLRAKGVPDPEIQSSLESIMACCQQHYTGTCAGDFSSFVCRGVPETLAALRACGAVLGLVTGNLSAIGWRKLELAGIRAHFSVGAFAEDGFTRAGLAALAARRAFDRGLLSQTAKVSLIGDHANDVQAAKANGYQSIAVATGLMPLEELRAFQPDILVSHLGELSLHHLL